jgi:hypothetical protein
VTASFLRSWMAAEEGALVGDVTISLSSKGTEDVEGEVGLLPISSDGDGVIFWWLVLVPCRLGTLVVPGLAAPFGRGPVPPCVPHLRTLPLCSGGLRLSHHTSHGVGSHLPTQKGSGAATRSAALHGS